MSIHPRPIHNEHSGTAGCAGRKARVVSCLLVAPVDSSLSVFFSGGTVATSSTCYYVFRIKFRHHRLMLILLVLKVDTEKVLCQPAISVNPWTLTLSGRKHETKNGWVHVSVHFQPANQFRPFIY